MRAVSRQGLLAILLLVLVTIIHGCSGSEKHEVPDGSMGDIIMPDEVIGDLSQSEATEPLDGEEPGEDLVQKETTDLLQEEVETQCPEGTPCDDGDPCTKDDECDQSGQCVGEAYTCDDGRECTEDSCDGEGDCEFVILTGMCLINGVCYEEGAPHQFNPCRECISSVSKTEWSNDDANVCEAGDSCLLGDYCDSGECIEGSEALECDDGDQCTEDSCDPDTGCVNEPFTGDCDDGDACTEDDSCTEGVCSGTPVDCDDGDVCTTDSCDTTAGCSHDLNTEPCDDGSVCTEGDVCAEGVCVGTAIVCDDGDACNGAETCDLTSGCVSGTAMECGDGIECTTDICANDACTSTLQVGWCLIDGVCIEDMNSNPDNYCTYCDAFLSPYSWKNKADGIFCDDGNYMTTDDACESGECVGESHPCEADCTGKDCGDDGCGGSCGECTGVGESCSADGQCVSDCTPDCTGKVCGDDTCGGSCGECGVGETCSTDGSECLATTELQPFGAVCGISAGCQPYITDPATGNEIENPAYPTCMSDQCDTGWCFSPYCTKQCQLSKDQVNNATGESGPDGIEDEDSPMNDCAGAYDGVMGTTFRCVNLGAPGMGTYTYCLPGTTFAACTSDADCPDGESCQINQINGVMGGFCGTAPKDGAGAAQACNDDSTVGEVVYCDSTICLSYGGCSAMCGGDSDCLSTVGACQGGTCANSYDNTACTADADCSAWYCYADMLISEGGETADLCWPRGCATSEACIDTGYYCDLVPELSEDQTEVLWTNGCFLKEEGGVAMGEECDPDPDDDIPGDTCENRFCLSGICSGLCEDDSTCTTGMLCGTVEYPFDIDDDGEYDDIAPFGLCSFINATGTFTTCDSPADCADGQDCKPVEQLDGDTYVINNYCADAAPYATETFGGACGGTSGQNCINDLCLGSDYETGDAGFCTQLCTSYEDCPQDAVIEIYGQALKSLCSSILMGYGGTIEMGDELLVPTCQLAYPTSSLADCSADMTCASDGEACMPNIITTGCSDTCTIEYLCQVNNTSGTAPTLDVGAACDPESNEYQCKGILCMEDVPTAAGATGYCSKLCDTDDDCTAGGADMICDEQVYLECNDPNNNCTYKLCKKQASCIPCYDDSSCAGDYVCVNVGGVGPLADYRCAPPCTGDADCAGTDGGATCVKTNDDEGNAEKLACVPDLCI